MDPVESLLELGLDWPAWFERWERLLAGYNPEREEHHRLLLAYPGRAPARVIDLCAGPGATSRRLLAAFPKAQVWALEADPRQVAIGRGAAAGDPRLRFVRADLRVDWPPELPSTVDWVISSTGLHWLAAESLAAVYRAAFERLRPGGWLLVSDHMAEAEPAVRARQAALRAERRRLGENWDAYWTAFEQAVTAAGGNPTAPPQDLWQGSDDGLPKEWHLATLGALGFVEVAVARQDLSEAVLAARRPGGEA